MFTKPIIDLLEPIGINIQEYWDDISIRLGGDVKFIDALFSQSKPESFESNRNWFIDFCEKHKITNSGILYNHLYDMSIALLEFRKNGRLGYFKARQICSHVPPINLNKCDIPAINNINLLDSEITIYRGMSNREFNSGNFTQHWTKNLETAKMFAFDTYDEFTCPRVLVEAKIKKQDVIFFDPYSEDEIIPKLPVCEAIINPKIIDKS